MDTPTLGPLDACRADLAAKVFRHLQALMPSSNAVGISEADVYRLLEKPPERKLGDYALPCFRFAKPLGRKPNDIASELAAALEAHERMGWLTAAKAEGAFLNLVISKSLLAKELVPAVLNGSYFQRYAANGTHVMIEYSQPNTHKEFHVGHVRNVALGDSLCRLFRYCGYKVVGANYIGDEGTHIAKCLWYIKTNGLTPPEIGRGEWLGKMYSEASRALEAATGEEAERMKAGVSAVHRALEAKQGETFTLWQTTREWSLAEFDRIYRWLDVVFDQVFFESELTDESQEIVDEYLGKGVFQESEGAIGVDLKAYKLGFLIVRKRDGATLYATKDLALARRKFDDFAIDRSVYVVGSEQNLHFKQVFKTLELMGFAQAKHCFHLSYGMVRLPEGKMSSRSGNVLTFAELRQQIGDGLGEVLGKYRSEWSAAELEETTHRLCAGTIKYGMLGSDPVKDIVFELKDWLSFEGNTGPYLMYSYARTQSILRKAAQQGYAASSDHLELLEQPEEHELLRYLYDFNDVVGNACESYKPSALAVHLFYLCKEFSRFYSQVPVLKVDSNELRGARLALIAAFSCTLKVGLGLLGITPPERM